MTYPSALRGLDSHPVDVPITCTLTRFGLRSSRHLASAHRDYKKIVRAAESSGTAAHGDSHEGLLRCAFLMERPSVWYSLSIWAGENAVAGFGTAVPDHGVAARKMFSRLAFDPERGPELWSTKWRLMSVTHNLNWEDFDLRARILDMMPNEAAS